MNFLTLKLPAMFGDHHVIEVRRLLSALPGVGDIYASSSYHTVEIHFEGAKLTPEEITEVLADAGYLDEMVVPVETGAYSEEGDDLPAFFRASTAYKQTGNMVSFAQDIPYSGRPIWPCPGFGPISHEEEVEHA